MSEPIDIIIPWVNPEDPEWKASFEHYKAIELGNKDTCRYRDWGFIKYALRSIEVNCPWVRYVFLVLASESQIPNWLNVDCPKLKIVYHRDYIPEEFLPTFNSNVIEMFYHNIKELSEHFILCNDDVIFWTRNDEHSFFNDNLAIISSVTRSTNSSSPWETSVKHTLNLCNSLLNRNDHRIAYTQHLACPYIKSWNTFIFNKAKEIICLSLCKSKFRLPTNIMHFLFYHTLSKSKLAKVEMNSRPGMMTLMSSTQMNIPGNTEIICFNESEKSIGEAIRKAIYLLDERFPNKSSFERT